MMTKRAASLSLDLGMLLVFSALVAWRLTGVPIHEWAAVVLLAALLTHLLIHWHWIESRSRQLRTGPWRTRVNVLLNLLLFATMGAGIISGFVISKVIFPNTLSPADYLRWHSLHGTATTSTLVVLGLHVALNWDLIAAGFRRLLRRRKVAPPPRETASDALRGLSWSALPRRVFIIAIASAALVGATTLVESISPGTVKVTIVSPNGRVETRDPPPGITRLFEDERHPSLARGIPALVTRLTLLALVAAGGRKLLRLRLS